MSQITFGLIKCVTKIRTSCIFLSRGVAALNQNVRQLATTFDRSNTAHILHSPLSEISIPEITIPQAIWENIGRWSEKIAMICSETNRTYTYNDLYKYSRIFGASLRLRLKLQDRDTIGLVLPNVPEYGISILGALEANLIVSPVNPGYTTDEVKRQLIESASKCVITTNNLYPIVKKAIGGLKHIENIILIDVDGFGIPEGVINFRELIETSIDTSVLDTIKHSVNELCLLPFSSGTSGLPKGVKLSHKSIVSNMLQIGHKDCNVVKTTTHSYQDVIPVVLPMFHIYGLVVVYLENLRKGCKLITMPKFSPQKYFKMIKEFDPTLLFLVPPIVLLMNTTQELVPKDVHALRIAMSGAAPLGAKDIETFLNKYGHNIRYTQGYGLTETSPVIAYHNKLPPVAHPASVGGLLANTQCQIRSIDNDKPVPVKQIGEILVKGPQVMIGYLNNEKANKETFTEDGWLRTGDIGFFDENGHLFITDRMKEMIKVKAFQVAPAELEELLRSHPDVKEAAVVGIPHPQSGEVPKAFVVPYDMKIANEEKLIKFVAANVTSYKRLAGGIKFVESIPKSPSGKILRRLLKEE